MLCFVWRKRPARSHEEESWLWGSCPCPSSAIAPEFIRRIEYEGRSRVSVNHTVHLDKAYTDNGKMATIHILRGVHSSFWNWLNNKKSLRHNVFCAHTICPLIQRQGHVLLDCPEALLKSWAHPTDWWSPSCRSIYLSLFSILRERNSISIHISRGNMSSRDHDRPSNLPEVSVIRGVYPPTAATAPLHLHHRQQVYEIIYLNWIACSYDNKLTTIRNCRDSFSQRWAMVKWEETISPLKITGWMT